MNADQGKRVVFLDRDGTINVDRGYVHDRHDWEFAPGAMGALRRLQELGFTLIVVTNQSGVGRGYYEVGAIATLHAFVCDLLQQQGVQLAGIFYCPHGPDDGCECRKPAIGLARQAEQLLQIAINYSASWSIGDKLSDVGFGSNLGTKTALLKSRYWSEIPIELSVDVVASSLPEAVEEIARRG